MYFDALAPYSIAILYDVIFGRHIKWRRIRSPSSMTFTVDYTFR